jgi:undecaprenyl-diphosphatase
MKIVPAVDQALPNSRLRQGGDSESSDGQPASSRAVMLFSPHRGRWIALSEAGLLGFVVVLALVLALPGPGTLDRAVRLGVAPLRSGFVTRSAEIVTTLGDPPVVLAVAALVALALWRRTRSRCAPAVLLGSVALTAGLVFLLKIAVSRPRPPLDTLIGSPALDYSFPSGHTTDGSVVYLVSAVLVGATVAQAARRLLLTLAVLVAVAVGLSRIYLGYHWATDVLGGWLLAAAVVGAAASVARAVAPPVRGDLALEPAPAPTIPASDLDASPTARPGRGDRDPREVVLGKD